MSLPLLVAVIVAAGLALGWRALAGQTPPAAGQNGDLTTLAEHGDTIRLRDALKLARIRSSSWRWAYFMGLAHLVRGEAARAGEVLGAGLGPDSELNAGPNQSPIWKSEIEDGVNLLARAYRGAPRGGAESELVRVEVARRVGVYGVTLTEPQALSLAGAPGSLLLLAVLAGVFVIEAFADGLKTADLGAGGVQLSTLVRLGGNAHDLTVTAGEWWRLFASVLLHGGLLHLAFNAYALYLFGPQVESRVGAAGLLVVFWLTGLGGALATAFLSAPNVISVGASGGLFGLLGFVSVYGAHGLKGRLQQLVRSLPNLVVLLLINGLLIPNVDNFGHAGGLVSGLLLGLAYRRPSRAAERGLAAAGYTVLALVIFKMLTASAAPI